MRLKELRMKKNLSQKEFANLIGINPNAYNKQELGKSNPDIEMLIKYANFFNVSVDYLIGRTFDNQIQLSELSEDKQKLINTIIEASDNECKMLYAYYQGMTANKTTSYEKFIKF